ncbi:hypothetical protein V2I01_22500 [Micromonospora sp. BRA006-A]|nr:hypothetical protein [Micromonospora sp. BRA006-A]
MTVRLARWSAEHPWRAIALWVVFVAVCFVGGSAAGLNEATDEDQAIGEFGQAQLIVDSGGFDRPATENVLITARSGSLDQAAAKAAAQDAADRLRRVDGVASIGTPMPSRDGSALLVPITMSGDPGTAGDRVQPLRTPPRRCRTRTRSYGWSRSVARRSTRRSTTRSARTSSAPSC